MNINDGTSITLAERIQRAVDDLQHCLEDTARGSHWDATCSVRMALGALFGYQAQTDHLVAQFEEEVRRSA